MKLARRSGVILLATVTLFVCGAVLLFELHVRSYHDLRMGIGLIRVGAWVVYGSGAVLIALAAISAFVRRDAMVAATGIIALILFGCSLRTVEFDPLTVAISEHWAGFTVSSGPLTALNEQGYCYELKPLTLRFRVIGTAERLSYFRGIWPSQFSELGLTANVSISRCSE